MIVLCVNALAYCSLLMYYLHKYKSINLGIIVLFIFAIASIGSIWYYSFDITPTFFPHVYPIPLIYLFILVWICLKPFLDFDISRINGIDDSGIRPVLLGIAGFLSVFTLLPFFELIMKAFSVSLEGSFLGQMYEADLDRSYYLFSPFGNFSFALIRHTGPLPVILFFYLLTIKKANKLLIIGTLLSALTMTLFSFMAGSRGGVIGWVCTFIFGALLFRNSLSPKIYKLIKICGVFFLVGVVFIFIAISFSRVGYGDSYQSSSFSVERWFAQYLGMGFLYFSDLVWNMTKFSDGDQNFGLIKSWIGLYNYASYENYIFTMENYLGVKLTEFYTFIGDIYCDFGRVGTIIFSVIFFFLGKLTCKNNSTRISMLRAIVLFIMFKFLFYGFAANLYRTIAIQKELVYPIIIGILLVALNNRSLKRPNRTSIL